MTCLLSKRLFLILSCVIAVGFVPSIAGAQDLPLPGKTLRNTAPLVEHDLTEPAVAGAEQGPQAVEMEALESLEPVEVLQPIKDVKMPAEKELSTVPPVTPVTQKSTANPAPKNMSEPVPEDVFFDSESLVPQTEMGRKGVPRKVNPRAEPASKYIVVRKNNSANSVDAQLIAAERAMKLGRYESAAAMYDELYTRKPRDANVLLGRATAYQHLDRAEDAMRVYEELLDLKPDFIEAEVNMLGLLSQKFPAVALERLLKMWDNNPNNLAVAAQIAVVQGRIGRYQEAVRFLGIAAGLEPENANHVYNMAVIADRAGDKKQAVKYYEEALEIDSVYGGGRTIPRDAVFERLAALR